ncbi:MAG: LysM peptidoglycan-binding domain-containing protein [Elusimicrobia bacterium]|nr:LysM peptidoglycan-binding domain-containing protein [Elusimicrobiota bacterium]
MRGSALALAVFLLAAAPLRAAPALEVRTSETSLQDIVVRPGDTLWSIAHKYLKDPTKWGEILKHNRLPTSDPTAALPGMVLRVPVRLIKTNLRAARLVYVVNRVLYRRRDTADWRTTRLKMQLYEGDALRTLDESKARVIFLNQELLNLDPNSMAVIKPVDDKDADVILRAGSVFAGRARVVTASARVTPRTRDTRYAASVLADLSTKVEVYRGEAAVDAQGSRVDVPAGMQTTVQPGLAPEPPRPLDNPPMLAERAQEFESAKLVGGGAAPHPEAALPAPVAESDASSVRGDLGALSVGVPILGYHVQAATDRGFAHVVFSRKYDSDQTFTPAGTGLKKGAYWWRVAVIDLLGTEGPYSEPHYYSIGGAARGARIDIARAATIVSPSDGDYVDDDSVRVVGILHGDGLSVRVQGRAARVDGDGNFVAKVPLKVGANVIEVVVSDGRGDQTTMTRRVTRR